MAPSSVAFPPTTPSTEHPPSISYANPKADQIVWKFFSKVVLVIAHARLTNDPHDLPGERDPDDTGTPTASISSPPPPQGHRRELSSSNHPNPTTRSPRPSGPKLDKWFNLEIPEMDTFRTDLHPFRSISTAFPIGTSGGVPPLFIHVLLSIPQVAPSQALVLNHGKGGKNRTRIDPPPRYILLESWRVDVVRQASESRSRRKSTGDSSSSTSSATTSGSSSGATSAQYDVELPTVYKQLIALFRSIHTLLRILPLWKLQRRLKKPHRAGRSAMSLELRINSPESLHSSHSTAASSSTSYDSSLPDSIDGSPIIPLTTPLSKTTAANRLESFSFPGINSPLGELRVQAKYRAESNFTLESLESLISDGFSENATIEVYSLSTYPAPPYPPIHSRVSTVDEERSSGDDNDREFEALEANFTPTVVAEEQRRRRESQLGRASTSPPGVGLYGLSRSPLNRPGSLPRDTSAVGRWRNNTPTQTAGTSASPPPARPRFTSIPQPQNQSTPTAPPMINTSTTSQIPRAPLSAYPSTTAPAMHTRTISMPPINRPATTTGSSIARFAGLSRIDDLPFASTPSIQPNSASTRRRKESSSALSSTSSAGAASAMPISPLRTASPRSRAVLLPLPTPPQPPSSLGSSSGPRRPSLNAIHPFKSSTLSSSPGSFGSGKINSPVEPPITASGEPRGSLGSIREFGPGLMNPDSPRFGNRTLSPRLGGQATLEPVPSPKRLSQGSSDGRSVRLSGADIGSVPSSKRYSSSFANRYVPDRGIAMGGESGTGSPRRSEDVPRDSLGLAGAGLPIPAPSSSRRPRTEDASTTNDDDINDFMQAIEARPELRGGSLPRSPLGIVNESENNQRGSRTSLSSAQVEEQMRRMKLQFEESVGAVDQRRPSQSGSASGTGSR